MSDVSLSVSNVSLTVGQGQAGVNHPRRAAFQQLAQALQSGDLAGAQQSFATLQQYAPKGATGTGPLGSDISGLGQALQSGDLAGAQKAFATLQQDVQKLGGVRGHHHHPHRGVSATQGPQPGVAASSASDPDQDGDRPRALDLTV
jgi:thioredoxin-like negative regulator of GroEL